MASVDDALEILQPDDFHHHLRDDELLPDVLRHATRYFGRIVAMPNIKPPVRTVVDVQRYKSRISSSFSDDIVNSVDVLMTLYLTDCSTSDEITEGHSLGLIKACKLYPAGATTNSEYGVTNISKLAGVLKVMSDIGIPLLIHGEVVDPSVDVFDRENVFIATILNDLVVDFPDLKIVLEHITTADAVEFVKACGSNVAATITAHHLLYNRNDIFKGGICPHMYCLPILKREKHRVALLQAATSGNPKFFIGTDSAPHAVGAKESACGCAGIFTGHAAIELYAEAFDSVGCLDKLEGFCSVYGAQFYGLPLNSKRIRLVRQPWLVPLTYTFGAATVRPMRAGEEIAWTVTLVE